MKKDKVKFNIKEIERSSSVSLKKGLLIILEIYCIYGAYRGIEAMRDGGSVAVGMLCSIIALVCTCGLAAYMQRGYRCIPVSDKLDAEVLKESVEKEKFLQAGDNIWKSDYWVKIGKQLYPRNTVTRLEKKKFLGKEVMVIWTITGKKYRIKMNEDIQASWFPFLELLQRNKMENIWEDKQRKQKATAFFKAYIKEHETSELLNNITFLRKCIEACK